MGVQPRAAALQDLDIAFERGAEADRGRAGRLVLPDPVLEREAARAQGALGVVDPGPDAGQFLALRRGGGLLDRERVLELDQLPVRAPLGAGGDEGAAAADTDLDLAGRRAQDPDRLPLLAEQPGGADARMAGEIQLQPWGEDPDPAARGVVDEDRLREAELGGHVLAPLLRNLLAVEEDPERVAELPLGVTEDAQNVKLCHYRSSSVTGSAGSFRSRR